MKGLTKLFVYIFLIIGVFLVFFVVFNITAEQKLTTTTFWDIEYLKTLGEISNFIALPWSIAGVFLLYLTLNIQQKQFAETEASIKRQQFETTFFNMLNVLTEIKSSLSYEFNSGGDGSPSSNTVKSNNVFFEFALRDLKSKYVAHHNAISRDSVINSIAEKARQNIAITDLERGIIKDDLNNVYLDFYNDYHSYFGHYFRYVYNLVKFAIQSRSKEKDEKTYIDLIQAQLTDTELSLIFYNVYSDNGLNRHREYQFQKWLDKYEFFENIDERSLLMREHHILYNRTRFKFLNADELQKKLTS